MLKLKEEIGFLLEQKVCHNDKKTPYRKPLVSFLAADDPGFLKLKRVVTPNHLLPQDILPEAKTVIAFFIPFGREIVQENRKAASVATSWAQAYVDTNQLIGEICQAIHDLLAKKGYKTSWQPATHNFDPKTLEAKWSHRSVAYLAGMGSFGVNRMLITPAGCAGRFGSLVTSAVIPSSKVERFEYCLYKKNNTCTYCVDNCPTGALTLAGIDRKRCYAHLLEVAEGFKELGLCDVCGKCLGGPCALK
ncbi:MAG: epoxyqueuosine reductase [Zhaonellaceae bacterium]